MSSEVDRRISLALEEAERERRCLVAPDKADRDAIYRRLDKGEIVSPFRGLYARASTWSKLSDPQKTCWAAQGLAILHPNWVFCSFTAAAIHGLYVSNELVDRIHVILPSTNHSASSIFIARHHVHDAKCMRIGHALVTPLADTVMDCLQATNFEHGLPIADSALRYGGLSRNHLVKRLREERNHTPGIKQALLTASYADPRSESGGESLSRAVLIEEGFALPDLQVVIPHPFDYRKSFRVDFLWTLENGSLVIGEFDGMIKLEDESMLKDRSVLDTLREERNREAALTACGAKVARFTYRDVKKRHPFVRILTHYGVPRMKSCA